MSWLPPHHDAVPASELERRLRRVQAGMAAAGIDTIVASQLVDVFWLAGTILSGWVVVPAAGDPRILVHRGVERAASESAWSDIALERSSKGLVASLDPAPGTRVGLELDVLPAAEFRKLAALVPDGVELVDASGVLRAARSVKSPWELERVDRAALQVRHAMGAVLDLVVPGATELDVAIAVEHELRLAGHQGVMRMRRWGGEMFYGQVSAGENSALTAWLDAPLGGAGQHPSVGKGASLRELVRGDLLVLDLMGSSEGYLSDCTRVVAVGGIEAVPGDLLDAQAWCTHLLADLEAMARPGVAAGALHEHALARAAEDGYADRFMGAGTDQARFVGHGIGLEVDEPPFLARGFDTPLEAGMVFAIEPKLVFPGRAAVGIEDAFVVTEDGVRALPALSRAVLVGG